MLYYEILPGEYDLVLDMVDDGLCKRFLEERTFEEKTIQVKCVNLKKKQKYKEDLFASAFCPPIVSEDMKRFIEENDGFNHKNIQLIETEVVNYDTEKKYFIMNIMDIVDCIDDESSVYEDSRVGRYEWSRIYIKTRLDKTKADGHDIFRLKGDPHALFISERFYNEFKKLKSRCLDLYRQ
ncbi:MAG: hypothetical protein LBT20_04895 [Clostridiales bacterium]|nr:hypothetical protein [Clostridiales bacterium]